MEDKDYALAFAEALNLHNKYLLQQALNPGAVVVFPSYEDWIKNMPECEKNGDTSLDRYWKERKEAVRRFALNELNGESLTVRFNI